MSEIIDQNGNRYVRADSDGGEAIGIVIVPIILAVVVGKMLDFISPLFIPGVFTWRLGLYYHIHPLFRIIAILLEYGFAFYGLIYALARWDWLRIVVFGPIAIGATYKTFVFMRYYTDAVWAGAAAIVVAALGFFLVRWIWRLPSRAHPNGR